MPTMKLPFPTLIDALVWFTKRSDRAFIAVQNAEPFTKDMDARWIETPTAASPGGKYVTGEEFDQAMRWCHQRASWQGGELYDYVAQLTRGAIDPVLRDRILPKLAPLEADDARDSFWTHMVEKFPHLRDVIEAEWNYQPPPVMDIWTDPPQWPTLDVVGVGFQSHVSSLASQASVLALQPNQVFGGPLYRLSESFTQTFEPYLRFIDEHVKRALRERPVIERQLHEIEDDLTSLSLRPLFDSGVKQRAWKRFRRILESIYDGRVPVGAAVPVASAGGGIVNWCWKWSPSTERAARSMRTVSAQDIPDASGYVQHPVDPAAYVSATEVLNEYVPEEWALHTLAHLKALLKTNPSIRRHKPSKRRLSIHLGDWLRFKKAHPQHPSLDGAGPDVEPTVEQIAERAHAIRKGRRGGR